MFPLQDQGVLCVSNKVLKCGHKMIQPQKLNNSCWAVKSVLDECIVFVFLTTTDPFDCIFVNKETCSCEVIPMFNLHQPSICKLFRNQWEIPKSTAMQLGLVASFSWGDQWTSGPGFSRGMATFTTGHPNGFLETLSCCFPETLASWLTRHVWHCVSILSSRFSCVNSQSFVFHF